MVSVSFCSLLNFAPLFSTTPLGDTLQRPSSKTCHPGLAPIPPNIAPKTRHPKELQHGTQAWHPPMSHPAIAQKLASTHSCLCMADGTQMAPSKWPRHLAPSNGIQQCHLQWPQHPATAPGPSNGTMPPAPWHPTMAPLLEVGAYSTAITIWGKSGFSWCHSIRLLLAYSRIFG